MTKILSPKVATPAAPAITPTAPSIATPAVQAAADAERLRQRQSRGRAATMLSGGTGDVSAANVGTTKLLGG